ncbi:MAG: ABC transporter ATP-binding protein [Fulvivirga sp.]|uniref:ABC transporter ATP-binding protein n=1 Tax=Fulvivirga sp. TaxID=1931237 RepID=UPI0032ECE176
MALAFYSATKILLLDEPTTNLDKRGSQWFYYEMEKTESDRLLILASNQENEYNKCDSVLDLSDFKDY